MSSVAPGNCRVGFLNPPAAGAPEGTPPQRRKRNKYIAVLLGDVEEGAQPLLDYLSPSPRGEGQG